MPERIKGDVADTQNRLAPGCREAAENLSGYLEHDLPFSRRRFVARHLRRCIDCRALLDSLTWTVWQLRALGRAEVASPSVAKTVVERISADRAQLLQ